MGQYQWSSIEYRQCNNYEPVIQGNQGSIFNMGIFNVMVVDSLGILGIISQIGRILLVSFKYILHMFHYSQYICNATTTTTISN